MKLRPSLAAVNTFQGTYFPKTLLRDDELESRLVLDGFVFRMLESQCCSVSVTSRSYVVFERVVFEREARNFNHISLSC